MRLLFRQQCKAVPGCDAIFILKYKQLTAHIVMITQQVIDTLYKQYKKAPKSQDCLNMPLLFDAAGENHNISVDFDDDMNAELIIGSIDPKSPFHRMPMSHIHAIVPFEDWVAIVLHSSIIFLNKKDSRVSIHIRPLKETLMDKIRRGLSSSTEQLAL